MFIVPTYTIAVILCVVTMLCWGSWANTLKLSPKGWAFPLYYRDYSPGVVLLALIFGLTLGNIGPEGRERPWWPHSGGYLSGKSSGEHPVQPAWCW